MSIINLPNTIPLAGQYVPPFQTAGGLTTITTVGGQTFTSPLATAKPYKKNMLIKIDRGCPLGNHAMTNTDGVPTIGGWLNDAHQALRAYRLRVAYIQDTNQHMGRLHRVVVTAP